MGCASSHSYHDQRPESRLRQALHPHQARKGRREGPHRDRSGEGGPQSKREGWEEPQRERRGGGERHRKTKEEEQRDGARYVNEELHREQQGRAEPPIKRLGQKRLHKGQRVPGEPHSERIRQKKSCEEMRRRVDAVSIGWAHPYVRQGLGFKYNKARHMRDEARRQRYEPIIRAKENFRRQYDEYKKGKGVTANSQGIVPAPQMTCRNIVAPSISHLSGMTLVD